MLTEQERAVLGAVAELARVIAENDTAGAAALCAAVNAMDLTAEQENLIRDTVIPDRPDPGGYRGNEGYLALVDGLDCIANKTWRKKLARAELAVYSRDDGRLDELIAEAAAAQPLLDGEENDYMYLALVLRACQLRKDYKRMDLIRERLGE